MWQTESRQSSSINSNNSNNINSSSYYSRQVMTARLSLLTVSI